MKKLVGGNEKVGCQAIFYCSTEEEAIEVGDDCKAFLIACRNGDKVTFTELLKKYTNERFMLNWLYKIEDMVATEEYDDCWIKNGLFWGDEF